jgi:hypothetical protein
MPEPHEMGARWPLGANAGLAPEDARLDPQVSATASPASAGSPFEQVCPNCGTAFPATRRSRRFCSGPCRTAAWKARGAGVDALTLWWWRW